MALANLSSRKAIALRFRGDGKSYQVMLFSAGAAGAPASRSFRAGEAWAKHRSRLADFAGADGSGLIRVFIGGGAEAGPFELLIDDVRFE